MLQYEHHIAKITGNLLLSTCRQIVFISSSQQYTLAIKTLCRTTSSLDDRVITRLS